MRSGSRCPAFYGEIPPMRWGILDDDGGYFYCIIYSKLGTFPTRGRHALQPALKTNQAPRTKKAFPAHGEGGSRRLTEEVYSDLRYQLCQVRPESLAQVLSTQGELDRSLEETKLIAEVVAHAFEVIGVDRLPVGEHLQRIGQLDLSAFARQRMREDVEDRRCDDIPAQHGHAARRILDGRFLHHVEHPHRARIIRRFALDDAV